VAYEHSSSDQRYYTTHFIDGLHDDIKVVVLVQRPIDLDTACSLALLQEETTISRRREFKKTDYSFKSKSVVFATQSLPLPPVKMDKGLSTTDKRSAEVQSQNSADGKVAALCAYRKAKGLC
jgi:hypothetical protein